VPATIFVATGNIGGTFADSAGNSFMILSEREMREMRASGLVEFLSHTRSHTPLPALGASHLDDEIEGARQDIEHALGEPVPHIFAYPKGRVTEEARQYLRAHKWAAAGTERGLVQSDSDSYAFPRNAVYKDTSWNQFRAALSTASDWARVWGR